MKKLNNIKTAIVAFGLLTSSITVCQETNHQNFKKEANHFFGEAVHKLGIPGFAVVVTQGDKTILSEGYGYADFENKLKADSNTDYYIASTTKSFTALLAVMLNDEGVIKLDDSLQKYFPDTKVDSGLNLSTIKVRDLLTHTSGISNESIGWRVAFSGEHDRQTLLNLMKYCVPNETGYGNYEYTNTGYNIYAIIVEKVTGKSWGHWVQKKILKPAGMHHTSAFISEAKKKNWTLAKPYMVVDSIKLIPLEKKDNTMQSAGGLISTPNDMSIWLKLQTGKGKLNGKQIFPERIIIASQQRLVAIPEGKRMFLPTHYGMGWMFGQYKNQEVTHHFGGFAGFSTHVSFMPEKKIGITIMVNEAIVGNELMSMISSYVYDYFIGTKDFSLKHENELNEFAEKTIKLRGNISKGMAGRNNREWLLSQNTSEYSGQFSSEEYGTITVAQSASGFKVSIGNMQCESTPFKNEDSIRVELIPGSGQVIQFISEDQKITGLKYDGIYFERIN